MMRLSIPELLAPAGSLNVALAALDAGADAVYAGLKKFNARERGDNFTPDEMARLAAYTRASHKKLYLTFNTLIKESEVEDAAEELAFLDYIHPDALIVQDLGVVRMLREYFPDLKIHASTQMAIHNSAGIAAAAEMGISRVILERQTTLEEIRAIVPNANGMELELFVHGALCCSLSGVCLFSWWLGGGSGNRGKCAQPCRRCYRNASGKKGFYFSTRDLAVPELIPEFKKLGISSLKIEGRLRKADYVTKVVRAYRMLLDGTGTPAEAGSLLDNAWSREKSSGFFTRQSAEKLIREDTPGGVGTYCGRVVCTKKDCFEVKLSARVHVGDSVRIQSENGNDGQALTVLKMTVGNRPVMKAGTGDLCRIESGGKSLPANGILYKIGESHDRLERRAAGLPPMLPEINVSVKLTAEEIVLSVAGEHFNSALHLEPAEKCAVDSAVLQKLFSLPAGTVRTVVRTVETDGRYFLPVSVQKELRRNFKEWVCGHFSAADIRKRSDDRAKVLIADHRKQTFLTEAPPLVLSESPEFFTPETELPELRKKIESQFQNGRRLFFVSTLSHLNLLEKYKDKGIEIVAIPPFPVTNSYAALELEKFGVTALTAHLEWNEAEIEDLHRHSPLPIYVYQGSPVVLATRAMPSVEHFTDFSGKKFHVTRRGGLSMVRPDDSLLPVPPEGTSVILDRTTAEVPRNRSIHS